MQPLLLLSDETSIIHVQELHSWTNLQSFKEKVWIPSSQSLRDCTSIGFIKDVLLTRCSHIWLNCIIFKKKDNVLYRSVEFVIFGGHCEFCGQLVGGVWNRKIFGATHNIENSNSFQTFSDPFADYSNYSWFQARSTKWPPKKTNSTHRQSKSYL